MANKYAYGIFGQVIDEEEQVENPFKYVGAFGVTDEGNSLYYMRARYYDPEAGRFISKDPIGLEGGINMYAYVGNDPVNWIDPLGLEPSGTHPDYDPKTGEKYLHHEKYRFNKYGEVVTHDGRPVNLSKAEARAARKALRFLRGKFPKFFIRAGVITVIIGELADPAIAGDGGPGDMLPPMKCHSEPANVNWN